MDLLHLRGRMIAFEGKVNPFDKFSITVDDDGVVVSLGSVIMTDTGLLSKITSLVSIYHPTESLLLDNS